MNILRRSRSSPEKASQIVPQGSPYFTNLLKEIKRHDDHSLA